MSGTHLVVTTWWVLLASSDKRPGMLLRIVSCNRNIHPNCQQCHSWVDSGAGVPIRITGNQKILQETGIPDHLTCLLRNLYAGQEATVRTGHGTPDWFQIGKGVRQGCILSPCLFNLYAEHIMRNAGLEEAQAGIKIAGRNIHNLRYADDTTLMTESEELKSLLWK